MYARNNMFETRGESIHSQQYYLTPTLTNGLPTAWEKLLNTEFITDLKRTGNLKTHLLLSQNDKHYLQNLTSGLYYCIFVAT